MKIQLDTVNKTIKIEDDVELKELIKVLEKLLPKGLWKEYTLEANTVIQNWSQPIIIEKRTPYYPTPIWFSVNKTDPHKYETTCQTDNKTLALDKGVHNVEFNQSPAL